MQEPQLVHSFWRQPPPPVTTKPLEGDVTADVVVIGAGMAGLSSAYYLRRAGADVVLLERGAVGSQSSTRNYGELVPTWNFGNAPLETRRQWARFAQTMIPAVQRVAEEEGFDCGLTSSRFWMLAHKPAHVAAGRANVTEMNALGFEANWVEPGGVEVVKSPTMGAQWERLFRMNPYQLVQGFKDAAIRRGVRIHENSPVLELTDGPEAVAVTANGRVRAKKAVIAVNAFGSQFGLSDSYMLPVQIFALGTKPLPDNVAESIGTKAGESWLDLGEPGTERRFTARFLPDGRMMFGGGSVTVPPQGDMFTPNLTDSTKEIIKQEMFKRFPAMTPDHIDFWWGGTIARTIGERPIIGELPGTKSVILAIACNGKGMAAGSSAGRLVTELVQPGSVSDPDTLAFLQYTAPRTDAISTLEGVAYKLLQTGPARAALNMFFRK